MTLDLARIIFLAGCGQWLILIASALVPLRLDWSTQLRPLPTLLRQLFWIYGGYVVLSIVSLGVISMVCAEELASGTLLARAVCAYIATFWGIRLSLQAVLDAKPFLTTWWLRAGYHLLTAMFVVLTTTFVWAAVHPG
jgi:hypothetical protein